MVKIKVWKSVAVLIITVVISATAVFAVFLYTKSISESRKDPNNNAPIDNLPNKSVTIKFDQIVFLGDSITQGYFTYDKLSIHQTIFKKGMSADGMFSQKLNYLDGEGNLEDILNKYPPKILYIGFGMNDLRKTPEEFYTIYKENIKKIIEICPKAKIALVSITPINTDYSTNENIDSFNKKIKSIADEIGKTKCKYLDVNSLLKDSSGKLDSRYDSGDGMHLGSEGYDVLIEFYKKNLQW